MDQHPLQSGRSIPIRFFREVWTHPLTCLTGWTLFSSLNVTLSHPIEWISVCWNHHFVEVYIGGSVGSKYFLRRLTTPKSYSKSQQLHLDSQGLCPYSFPLLFWVLPPCNKPSMFPMLLGYYICTPPCLYIHWCRSFIPRITLYDLLNPHLYSMFLHVVLIFNYMWIIRDMHVLEPSQIWRHPIPVDIHKKHRLHIHGYPHIVNTYPSIRIMISLYWNPNG